MAHRRRGSHTVPRILPSERGDNRWSKLNFSFVRNGGNKYEFGTIWIIFERASFRLFFFSLSSKINQWWQWIIFNWLPLFLFSKIENCIGNCKSDETFSFGFIKCTACSVHSCSLLNIYRINNGLKVIWDFWLETLFDGYI